MESGSLKTGSGRKIRVRRLLKPNRPVVVVPLDHPVSMGAVDGLESMSSVVRTVRSAGADAVVMHKGSVLRLVERDGPSVFDGLCLVVHLSGATGLSPNPSRQMPVCSVDEAAEAGADWVSVQVNFGCSAEPEMLAALGAVTRSASQHGLPVLVMAYVRDDSGTVSTTPSKVFHAVRVAQELGADAVKIPLLPAVDLRSHLSRVEIPVLLAGGPRMEEQTFMTELESILQTGIAGLCVGRNVFQADDPSEFMSRISSLLHRSSIPSISASSVPSRGGHPLRGVST